MRAVRVLVWTVSEGYECVFVFVSVCVKSMCV